MTESQADTLVQALKDHFSGEAEWEAVDQQGRYRFAVTSPQFEAMPPLKRQDEVWKIVDQTLPREATMDISMISALAPADMTTIK